MRIQVQIANNWQRAKNHRGDDREHVVRKHDRQSRRLRSQPEIQHNNTNGHQSEGDPIGRTSPLG